MEAVTIPPQVVATSAERAHLARAHEELCTALTALRSNVDLAHLGLHRSDISGVRTHLGEVESAVDRLVSLARELRSWHDAT